MTAVLQRAPVAPIHLDSLPDNPLVSVIVSNYNYGRFLTRAVESVLAQTWEQIEILLCDDGSTDDSKSVIELLADRHPNVLPIYKANGGQSSAWNLAWEHATGQIIAFLDPDDEFLPTKVERTVEAFRANSRAGIVYHRYQPRTETGGELGAPFPRELESGWLASEAAARGGWHTTATVTSCLSVRREVAERVFPLPDEFRNGVSDAYIQSVAQFFTEFEPIPEVLTRYLVHGSNATASVSPNAASVSSRLDLYENGMPAVQRFVTRHFGPEVLARQGIDAIPSYWEDLAALYIFSGKPREGVRGVTSDQILIRLPDGPRRRIWRTLFQLPGRLSRPLLAAWWSQGRWKQYSRPITRLLRVG